LNESFFVPAFFAVIPLIFSVSQDNSACFSAIFVFIHSSLHFSCNFAQSAAQIICLPASKKHRAKCTALRLSKNIFDSLVDGGASSPATATPSRFHLNPLDSGREICKEAIFLRK